MVDGSGLENRQGASPRGFESHPLRHSMAAAWLTRPLWKMDFIGEIAFQTVGIEGRDCEIDRLAPFHGDCRPRVGHGLTPKIIAGCGAVIALSPAMSFSGFGSHARVTLVVLASRPPSSSPTMTFSAFVLVVGRARGAGPESGPKYQICVSSFGKAGRWIKRRTAATRTLASSLWRCYLPGKNRALSKQIAAGRQGQK